MLGQPGGIPGVRSLLLPARSLVVRNDRWHTTFVFRAFGL
jgi:hypothetical protein